MKILAITLAATAIGALSIALISKRSSAVERVVTIEGSFDVYPTFKEAEKESPLIVVGNLRGDFEKARFFKATEESGMPYAEREIFVTKVLKNRLPNRVRPGDKLKFLEPAAIMDDAEGKRTLYQLGDYIGVKKAGGPLLFFLTASGFSGNFSLTNMNLSRIPMGQVPLEHYYSNKFEEKRALGILEDARLAGLLK
ncbi:hypothetical protein [Deinococcus sedimenti]|nr:hypothetical protein [Deinococcus sedimenti]